MHRSGTHEVPALFTESELSSRCVGEYSGVTRTLHIEKCNDFHWDTGKPPRDRTIKVVEQSRINFTVFLILVSVSTLGIVMAASFLILNIKFRNER